MDPLGTAAGATAAALAVFGGSEALARAVPLRDTAFGEYMKRRAIRFLGRIAFVLVTIVVATGMARIPAAAAAGGALIGWLAAAGRELRSEKLAVLDRTRALARREEHGATAARTEERSA